LGQRQWYDPCLEVFPHSVAEIRLPPTDLLERRLAAGVVELPETIEAVRL
jgi:hypothetical protein